MPRDFIPRRDAEFLAFTSNLRAKIVIAPLSFGLTTQLAAHYAVTQESFAQRYRTAIDPGTRTVVAVGAKNAARETLEDETRMLAGIIRAFPGMTSFDLGSLGLHVRSGRRKRVPAPTAAPRLSVREVKGRRVSVQVTDRESSTRRKPRDAWSARLFAFIGAQPPVKISDWKYVKGVTRTRTVIRFGGDVPPGAMVWLTAQWSNYREQTGPFCTPVYTHLTYGGPELGQGLHARPEVSMRRFVDQQPEALKLAA